VRVEHSSIEGARIEAPKAPKRMGLGRGVPLPTGEGPGMPLLRKIVHSA